ncbi:hypothetical protein H0H87_010257 [Tephrocybe sp. NHM501043]|nr:hypothetical protein H0H87_010257 [Tephrocybe sp. NHM501043]
MFAKLTVLASIALLPFTLAQSTDVAAIEAHFKQSQIVPQLLASFEPSALLSANFAGERFFVEQHITMTSESSPKPTVTVTPANSTVTLDGKYTIMMVDADIVGGDLSKGENHHWLVNGVQLTDGKVSDDAATSIVNYAGPGPASGSGPHRYVIILYAQPDTFEAPVGLAEPTGVGLFTLSAYIKDSGLGPLVAATYFTVEDGTATASIPATSAVVSSTLAAASSASTTSGKVVAATSTSTTDSANPTTSNSAAPLAGLSPFGVLLGGLAVIVVA